MCAHLRFKVVSSPAVHFKLTTGVALSRDRVYSRPSLATCTIKQRAVRLEAEWAQFRIWAHMYEML